MNNFEIVINAGQLSSYSSGLVRDIGEKNFDRLLTAYANYVKNLYLGMIEESIYSKRYEGQWEPIGDEEYIKYLGVDPVKDTMSLLSSSMEIIKYSHRIVIRVNPKVRYPGSHLSVVQVLNSLEYGTSKFNARPIFRTIVMKVQSNILRLWRGYLFRKGLS